MMKIRKVTLQLQSLREEKKTLRPLLMSYLAPTAPNWMLQLVYGKSGFIFEHFFGLFLKATLLDK